MQRIVTVQDLSCFGKCSLTVALPVLSAMGIECAVIPTAVLSAHTGCFPDYTLRDLSGDIAGIAAHWKKNGVRLDGIYTGYLSSPEQASLVRGLIRDFAPPFVFVDPAMADNGRLYAGLDPAVVPAMRELCAEADLIVPNLTEAAFLLGEPYRPERYEREEVIREMLCGLTDGLGAKKAAITGVLRGDRQGVVCRSGKTGEVTSCFAENLPVRCHGTGDVFASALFGGMTRGLSLRFSVRLAVEFTLSCIRATMGDESHWYGVRFEVCLPELWEGLRRALEREKAGPCG